MYKSTGRINLAVRGKAKVKHGSVLAKLLNMDFIRPLHNSKLHFFRKVAGKKSQFQKEISQNIGTLSLKCIVYLPVKHDSRQFQEHRNSFNQVKWFKHMFSRLKYRLEADIPVS
jgi:hypothetical protein